METKNNNRIDYITFISVVSCVSVLILHTNGVFWQFSATESYWKTANVIESVFYFAVPLFFMITGITLMDFYDKYTLKEYFAKRIKKTVIPFVAWSLIGVVLEVCVGHIAISDINIRFLYQGITGTTIVSMYWFFTPLFIIYLNMPLYAAVEKEKRKGVFIYLVVAGFILNNLIPFIISLTKSDLNTPYKMPVITGNLIWPVLGWLLHNSEISKKQKIVIYILAAMGLMIHMCGTYVVSMNAGEILGTFKGYHNVPSILYAVGVFVLLRDIGNNIMQHKTLNRFINWLSGYTFPVYLMQFVFLKAFPMLPGVSAKSMIYRLGAPFIIIPLIIAITWCIRKIPILKNIVP